MKTKEELINEQKEQLQTANKQLGEFKELLKEISNSIGKGSLNLGDCQVKIMKHLNK